jgi:Abortive infection alpha
MSDDADRGRAMVVAVEPDPSRVEELLRAAPGLARIVVDVSLRGAAGVANAYVNGASQIVRAASRGESTSEVIQEARASVRAYGRDLLGISDSAEARSASAGSASRAGSGADAGDFSAEALQRRGEELLRQSADVRLDEDSHPAYMRIIDALAPDEARILRFLAHSGPQPSVDVRSGLPLASELIAQGRTMIAQEAGCRHADRVYAYLNNLHRLGLIWFSRETIRDTQRYQLLEAQPAVVEAKATGGRLTRTVRRSIVLTPFGEDFCAICLPREELVLID